MSASSSEDASRPAERPRNLARALVLTFWAALLWTGWGCSSPASSTWPPSVAEFFLERFYWDLLICAVIAGVSIARDYAVQVRQQERQAHELALETADLERRLVEARLQSLRAQLQPHFLFNALNTISAFTETNPQTARRFRARL